MSEKIRRAFLAATPTPGDRAVLDPEESHHVARVLRLRTGDALAVFDGQGGEWEAVIDDAPAGGVRVLVGNPRTEPVEPEVTVVLHQALVRPEKLEWLLQKGTEIGIGAFRLMPTERVDAPAPTPSRLTRYGRILMEACKQCGRRRLPTLDVGPLAVPPEGVLAVVLAHGPGVATLGARLRTPPVSEVWLAVGPEGGWTDGELQDLASRGWRRASLGPRVLRTETAGCIAAAIVLHHLADLGPPPGEGSP
jgi:16S rRNA (uracil1498-N3)-methyltransferase